MAKIWKREISAALLNESSKNTLSENLGISIVEIGENYIKAKMPVDKRTKQPFGLLHGGANVALSETIGSLASALCIEGSGMPVGLEINANHLKSVTQGEVISITKPIRIGKRIHVWNTEIYDNENNLTCVSRLTIMIKS